MGGDLHAIPQHTQLVLLWDARRAAWMLRLLLGTTDGKQLQCSTRAPPKPLAVRVCMIDWVYAHVLLCLFCSASASRDLASITINDVRELLGGKAAVHAEIPKHEFKELLARLVVAEHDKRAAQAKPARATKAKSKPKASKKPTPKASSKVRKRARVVPTDSEQSSSDSGDGSDDDSDDGSDESDGNSGGGASSPPRRAAKAKRGDAKASSAKRRKAAASTGSASATLTRQLKALKSFRQAAGMRYVVA